MTRRIWNLPFSTALAISIFGACGIGVVARAQAQHDAAAPAGTPDARIWIGRAAEIEEYFRSVPIVKLEDLSVGVTKPKKATLPPGGPVAYLAWKAIAPGMYQGAWESYKAEVGAYELDKMLELNMVPPTVEKVYRGDHGAAVMWASPTKNFKEFGGTGAPTPPPIKQAAWNLQVVRAKMFDNLIGNTDPNLGNWLADPSWNIILIDHSRAFSSSKSLTHVMTHVDPVLWTKMLALTDVSLKPVLGPWIDGGQLRAVLQRRDKMKEVVDQLIKSKGENNVFMRDAGGR